MTDNAHQRAFFTVEQLAGRWQVSSRTVRRMLERYELRAIYVGKQLRIASDEVTRFEQRNSLTAALRQSSHTHPSRGGRLLGDKSEPTEQSRPEDGSPAAVVQAGLNHLTAGT